MRPLTPDDLMPLEDYAPRRREFFESHQRYLDRYRRVRIGPRVTLVFENRQTLWFRLQELLRIARLTESALVQKELDLYNRLLPGCHSLQAALIIEVIDETRFSEELAAWQTFQGKELALCLDEVRCPAGLLTARPEDRSIGVAHWVHFAVDSPSRRLLADFQRPGRFALDRPGYRHESLPLSDDVRQSLLDDLALSDRD
jgi:hypothetical protein